jgi:DNA-directed RNA polymerase
VTQEQFEVTVTKLDGKIDRLTDSVEAIKDTQMEMNEKVTNIEKAIYNPDEGLYARIKQQEAEIVDLKEFKANITKFLWIITSGMTGILIKFAFDLAG